MSAILGRKNTLFVFALLLLVNHANAGVELSIAAGAGWYTGYDTTFVISPSESDTDKAGQSSVDGSWKFGVGYSLLEDSLPLLHRLLLNLNVYQTSSTLSGAVW